MPSLAVIDNLHARVNAARCNQALRRLAGQVVIDFTSMVYRRHRQPSPLFAGTAAFGHSYPVQVGPVSAQVVGVVIQIPFLPASDKMTYSGAFLELDRAESSPMRYAGRQPHHAETLACFACWHFFN
jgi:hypothetical protein